MKMNLLSSKYNEGTKVSNTTSNVDKMHSHCSIVDSFVNGNTFSDVIWSFAPKTEP